MSSGHHRLACAAIEGQKNDDPRKCREGEKEREVERNGEIEGKRKREREREAMDGEGGKEERLETVTESCCRGRKGDWGERSREMSEKGNSPDPVFTGFFFFFSEGKFPFCPPILGVKTIFCPS